MTKHDFISDQDMDDGLIKRTCINIIAITARTIKGIIPKNVQRLKEKDTQLYDLSEHNTNFLSSDKNQLSTYRH